MNGKTFLRVFAATIAASAVVIGAADAAPKKSKYLYLMGSTPQGTSPIVVGVKKGFCKKLGLNIDMKLFTSGGVAAQSFIAGQGDWVVTGDWPAVRTWLKTQDLYSPHPLLGRAGADKRRKAEDGRFSHTFIITNSSARW